MTNGTQFEEFPRFMEGVKEVRQLDDKRLHWRAEVAGKEAEWDAEMVPRIQGAALSTTGSRLTVDDLRGLRVLVISSTDGGTVIRDLSIWPRLRPSCTPSRSLCASQREILRPFPSARGGEG